MASASQASAGILRKARIDRTRFVRFEIPILLRAAAYAAQLSIHELHERLGSQKAASHEFPTMANSGRPHAPAFSRTKQASHQLESVVRVESSAPANRSAQADETHPRATEARRERRPN
jgi:hypothetical protein